MSGIYIPGMEMPKSCSTEACFVRTVSYEDGTVWCPVAKGYLGDQATVCPLVPVPPHGRLTDADDFAKRMKNLVEKAENDGFDLGAAWYSAFVRHIELTPTIIQADGKDTNVPTKTAEEGAG